MSKLEDARKLFGTSTKHGAKVSSATVDGDLMRALLEFHQICENESKTPCVTGVFGPCRGHDHVAECPVYGEQMLRFKALAKLRRM
jgi:hypothetical protein